MTPRETSEFELDAMASFSPAPCSAFVRLFKHRFADLVESGVKMQTCRLTPKRMPKQGDSISLREWTGKPYRSKQRIIREATVTRTRRVEIWPMAEVIALDGQKLGYDETLNFAQADGFVDHWDLFQWFTEEHGPDKFEGIVIYWQNDEVSEVAVADSTKTRGVRPPLSLD